MKHIEDMGRSLTAVVNLTKLQNAFGFTLCNTYYRSEYGFFNVADYLTEAKGYSVGLAWPQLKQELFSHLQAADFILINSRDSGDGRIGADMFLTFTKDSHALFDDALLYTNSPGRRRFAITDIIHNCPPSPIWERGERTFNVLGWEENPEKDKAAVTQIRQGATKIEFCKVIDLVKWVYSGLIAFFPDEVPTAARSGKHYTQGYTDEKLRKLFDGLKSHAFLHSGACYSHFCYLCNGAPIPDEDAPFSPIQWIAGQNDLAYFVEKAFGNKHPNDLWAIAVKCFTINGREPSGKAMRDISSKIRGERAGNPRGAGAIDAILAGL